MMKKDWNPKIAVKPTAASWENSERALIAALIPAADNKQETYDHRRRPEQAELLADGHEDEVAIGNGDVVGRAEAKARIR